MRRSVDRQLGDEQVDEAPKIALRRAIDDPVVAISDGPAPVYVLADLAEFLERGGDISRRDPSFDLIELAQQGLAITLATLPEGEDRKARDLGLDVFDVASVDDAVAVRIGDVRSRIIETGQAVVVVIGVRGVPGSVVALYTRRAVKPCETPPL